MHADIAFSFIGIQEADNYNDYSSTLLFTSADSIIAERIDEEFTSEDVIERSILAADSNQCLVHDRASTGELLDTKANSEFSINLDRISDTNISCEQNFIYLANGKEPETEQDGYTVYTGDCQYDFYCQSTPVVINSNGSNVDFVGVQDGVAYKLFSFNQMGLDAHYVLSMESKDDGNYIVSYFNAETNATEFYLFESLENGNK